MKKIKFTFWLLGFGCGMALTGIVGTYCALNLQVPAINEKDDRATSVKQEEARPRESTLPSQDKKLFDNEDVTVIQKLQEVKETNKQNDPDRLIVSGNDQMDEEKKGQAVGNVTYKTIIIDRTASASEICQQLENEGLIESAEDFLAYIKGLKKQRFLKHGELSLPLNATYEVLLEELTV